MTNQSDQDRQPAQGSSSVRIAIVGFLGTMVLLLVMGLIWLFIRV